MKNSKGMIVLLVALAALTLVVVVGLFFFYPKETTKVPTAPGSTPGGPPATTQATQTPLPDAFDPVEWTRDPKTTAAAPTTTPSDQGYTVTLPTEPKTPGTTTLPASPGATFPGETGPAKPSTVQSTPVGSAAAPVKPAKVSPAPAPAPAEKVTKAPRPGDYWVQVGAFKDRYQAENTEKSLEAQGLKGTLSTATVKGVAVVRVRVGPYANEAEAAKFLAWLKPIKEFGNSYITK